MSEANETQLLRAENAALKQRVQEFEDTLAAIQGGEVDALVVSAELYTLESAHAAGTRLRQHVLDQMDEAVFAFDVDGHLVYLNAAAERRYVVQASEVLGRAGDAIFLESDLVNLAVADDASLENRISRRMSTHTLPGGRTLKVESSVSALVDHEGWTIGQLVVTRDVTQRLEADARRQALTIALGVSEAGLRAANENLEAAVVARTAELLKAQEALRQSQKMEAVGQLTGGIAHDFNNLLGAMSGALQVLKGRLDMGRLDGAERYIGMAQDSIKRAAALTQRLLAFARRQTLDPKPTDVGQLITGLEELLRRTVGPDVTLKVSAEQNLWTTTIDSSQLENAVLNLCINARDAMMPSGGALTVAAVNTWLEEEEAIRLGLAPGPFVSLCVTDTGSGMSPDVVARVFDPFFTTKPLGQGTGLGLSMVYGFVRQSGGQIDVDSALERGTTMRIYLPRHEGKAEPAVVEQPIALLAGSAGETVLVIEDEEVIRELVEEVLVEAGYQVVAAADGPAGLKLLESTARIDLLVTDVGLPGGLNGRQVADAARIKRPNLKVLFMTGFAESASVGNGQMEPGMKVLTKPFDMTTLHNTVKTMLLHA